MTPEELQTLAAASKLLARTQYREAAARLNGIITLEGGDPLKLCADR